MKYNVLIADDEIETLDITKQLLEDAGYSVDVAQSGKEAIEKAKSMSKEYALIIMDYLMPDLNGAEAANLILRNNPKQQVVVYSAAGTQEAAIESYDAGAAQFMSKKGDPELFLDKVKKYCLKYDQIYRSIQKDEDPTEYSKKIELLDMVGKSKKMADISDIVDVFSKVNQSILILGESGVGKEKIAQALHDLSPRKSHKFVAVNCAEVPSNLIESHLFGHIKGSYTSAAEDRVGKFALANKGTLFLDEIGDLQPEVQVKLLRVLQEMKIEAIGSNREINLDVRVVAATHKDIKKMIADGRFREDLYYRLKGYIINVPSLRERPEDIGPLIGHFTEKYCRANNVKKGFQKKTLEVFMKCSWPGNVRDLQQVIEAHLTKCKSTMVTIEDLDFTLFDSAPAEQIVSSIFLEGLGEIKSLSEFDTKLKKLKWSFIKQILDLSETSSEAARRLETSPARLYLLIKSLKKHLGINDGIDKVG